ncbi:MAG: peptidase M15 [Gammaproteobacteria bacterium]|nr:MAG: peptidase M15 [Gammaproteobacteria bacterium]
MGQYRLGRQSKKRLEGVDPRLVAIVKRAIELTEQDFTVIEGLRSKRRQKRLYKQGLSWTMNSKHLTGHAVDIAPWVIVDGRGRVDWKDREKFSVLKTAMFAAAKELGIHIRWGGDWNENGSYRDEIARGSYDAAHFELME